MFSQVSVILFKGGAGVGYFLSRFCPEVRGGRVHPVQVVPGGGGGAHPSQVLPWGGGLQPVQGEGPAQILPGVREP